MHLKLVNQLLSLKLIFLYVTAQFMGWFLNFLNQPIKLGSYIILSELHPLYKSVSLQSNFQLRSGK